jgi:hypothetical protein
MKTTMITGIATLVIASTAPAQQAVQWKASDGGNGHWYELILASSPTTWQDGQSYATQQGAHLATITAHTENLFLATYIQSNIVIPWGAGIDPEGCWLGGQRVGGTWTWCTSEPWMFTGWNQTQCIVGGGNQPDQDGASRLLQIACLSGGECRWDDICIESEVGSCTRPFILLEWSADCNSDGIVDYGQCHDGTLPDYNGNNIPDCCERGETCVVGNYPVQWRVEDGGNGHWYARFDLPGGGPFDTIRQKALALGGDLASITSASEDDFARSVASPFSWNHGTLIGTRTPPGCTNFVWSDGSPWGFTRWGGGQPDCKVGDGVGYYPDGWHDLYDFDVASFVIEWSTDCDADGVVDYGQLLTGQLADSNTDGVPDVCQQPNCVDADLFRDFNVNGADLGILLSQWGPNSPLTVSDINSDGVVNGADLGILLSFWGACSS